MPCVDPRQISRRLAILRDQPSPVDPTALTLAALGWLLADEARARRFLDLTGLTPDDLRSGLGDSGVLGSVLDFLAGHEPDLIAAARALDVEPGVLIGARERLGA